MTKKLKKWLMNLSDKKIEKSAKITAFIIHYTFFFFLVKTGNYVGAILLLILISLWRIEKFLNNYKK